MSGFPKMTPEWKQEWLRLLRSGEYRQVSGTLCKIGARGAKSDGFCCLGVIGDDLVQRGHAVWVEDNLGLRRSDLFLSTLEGDYRGEGSLLTSQQHLIGLDNEAETVLIDMNDQGKSFAEIADWIEVNL